MQPDDVTTPTVFVIDDDESIREALTLTLQQVGMTVLSFENAETFLEFFTREPKDCLSCQMPCNYCAIVDLYLPGMNGLRLQETLCDLGIKLPLIFLTAYGDLPASVSAIKGGAEDFLAKPVSRETLLAAVHKALHKCDSWHTTSTRRHDARERLAKLSDREREILKMVAEGQQNKQIATLLGISMRTVEHHRTSILSKTETRNFVELIQLTQTSDVNEA